MAAQLGRIPAIVATSHLYFPISGVRFASLKQRVQAAIIDLYVAVSNEVKERLRGDLRVREAKIRVVHPGVALRSFDRPADPAIRAMLAEGSERPIVFTAARLHPQKGLLYLVEAAALIPDAVFVVAGDGPDRSLLEKRRRELGLESRVRFLGHRQDISALLAACDLFVLPSLYEGLGLSILEAMAAGKPVVATAIGGIDEAVIHGTTGLLVPPRNPTELAAAIRSVLSNRCLAQRLAENGKAYVAKEFSAEFMVEGVAKVYDELLGFAA